YGIGILFEDLVLGFDVFGIPAVDRWCVGVKSSVHGKAAKRGKGPILGVDRPEGSSRSIPERAGIPPARTSTPKPGQRLSRSGRSHTARSRFVAGFGRCRASARTPPAAPDT